MTFFFNRKINDFLYLNLFQEGGGGGAQQVVDFLFLIVLSFCWRKEMFNFKKKEERMNKVTYILIFGVILASQSLSVRGMQAKLEGAAREGDLKTVKMLVKKGAPISKELIESTTNEAVRTYLLKKRPRQQYPEEGRGEQYRSLLGRTLMKGMTAGLVAQPRIGARQGQSFQSWSSDEYWQRGGYRQRETRKRMREQRLKIQKQQEATRTKK